VPAALPDGTPGFTAANQLMGRMARVAWDTLGAASAAPAEALAGRR
jgi:hypothetical protein